MTTLPELIDLVELDLRDSANAVWTPDELAQHVRRALRGVDQVAPRRVAAVIDAQAGVREYPLTALSGLIQVLDVWFPYLPDAPSGQEYANGAAPPRPPWELIADDTLLLMVDDAPQAGQALRVFYTVGHTLEGLDGADVTTLSWRALHAVELGATAYAAYQHAQDVIGEVTPSSWTPRQLLEWAEERMLLYQMTLQNLRRAGILMQDPRVVWGGGHGEEGKA